MDRKHRLLLKLIIIWGIINIYPIKNQFNHLTAYSINYKVVSIPTVMLYSTMAYLITLAIFLVINKISFNRIGKKILIITGILPILIPILSYKSNDGLALYIYGMLDILCIVSGIIIYIFQKRKSNFLEGMFCYLSQFLMLYLVIFAWQSFVSIGFEIILFVGIGTLFLSNLILKREFKEASIANK